MTDKFHDRNVQAVQDKMTQRAIVGLESYGTDTTRNDFTLRDWILELQTELMDATIYIEASLGKLPDPTQCPQCHYLRNKIAKHECHDTIGTGRFFAYLRNFDMVQHYERWEKRHPEEEK